MKTLRVTILQIPDRMHVGPGTTPIIKAVLHEDSKEVKFYILQPGQQANTIVKNLYKVGIPNNAAPCSTKKLSPKDGSDFLTNIKLAFERNRGHIIATHAEELKEEEAINDCKRVEKFFGTIESIDQTTGVTTVFGGSYEVDGERFSVEIPIRCFLPESQAPEVKKDVQALLIFEKQIWGMKQAGVIAAAVITPGNYPLFAGPSIDEEDLLNWAQTVEL